MHGDTDLVELAGLTLPADSTVLRDHVFPPDRRPKAYLEKYDRRTLFYDCVKVGDGRRVLITAPPFLNLWPEFRRGLHVANKPARIKRRRQFKMSEQFELETSDKPLHFSGFSMSEDIAVRDSKAASMEGLNCLFTVSQNEPLRWITDWVAFHVKQHGANGIVMVDNASTDYSPSTLLEHLRKQPGIRRALVYSARFPFGAPGGGGRKGERIPRFLQTAMLDMARRDALARARAVLNIDVDELVVGKGDLSVFDAAVRKRHSMVKIHGEWVYPAENAQLPAPHSAHVFRSAGGGRCKQKWCAVPSGFLSSFGWKPHHVGGQLVRVVKKSDDFHLLHCKGTSRGYKSGRFDFPELTPADPELETLMGSVFSAPAQR